MPITVISNIVPANNLTFPIVEDIHLKGGFRVADDITERDTIPNSARKVGMYVATANDNKLYQLESDEFTWTETSLGAPISSLYSRATLQVTAQTIVGPGWTGTNSWVWPTGKTCIVHQLAMSAEGIVEAHSSPARNDSNPYKFRSYAGHYVDDGSSLMSDGRLWLRPRETTLCNLEVPPTDQTYWSITNTTGYSITYTITATIEILEPA